MTDLRLHRLTVRCLAAPGEAARALAVRARLARVAAGPLPAALDRMLDPAGAPGEPTTLGRMVVRLDLDPAQYDDETLAVLWADGIRAALVRRLAPGAGGPTSVRPSDGTPRTGGAALGGTADPARAAAAERWAAELMTRSAPDVAGIARALSAHPGATLALYALLSPPARAAVLAALLAAVRAAPAPTNPENGPPGAAQAGTGAPGVPARRPVPPGAAGPDPGAPPASWRAAWRAAAAAAGAGHGPSALVDAALRLGSPDPAPSPVDRLALSAAGGLVLLYPWLASYLAEAVADRPAADPRDARRVGLALLADRDDRDLVRDPLVALLAGYPPAADLPDPAAAPPGAVSPAEAGRAEAVLRCFAAALPGFATAGPDYLRAHLIRRAATLEPVGQSVTVRLEPRPLDLAVHRLPYPLASIRLPWTPVLHLHLPAP